VAEEEQHAMQLPQQQKDGFTWNLNTVVLLGGFGITLASLAISYGQFVERSKNVEIRVDALEAQVRKIDTIDYRLTAAEAFGVTASRSLEEMRAAISQQSGDIRVMREILQRLESQSKAAVFKPGSVPDVAKASLN